MAKRTGIMLARPLEEKLLARMPEYVLVQPKLDGDRCRAVPAPEGYQLWSSQMTLRNFSVPFLADALNLAAIQLWGDDPHNWKEIDGELYIHGVSHQRIRSIVSRTVNMHPDSQRVRYHAFDFIEERPQYQRSADLQNLFAPVVRRVRELSRIIPVPTFKVVNSMESCIYAMNRFLDEGYEGAIIRHPLAPYEAKRSDKLLKLKPRQAGVGEAVGMNEAISLEGGPKGMIGSFLVKTILQGEEKVITVGAGKLTHAERTAIFEMDLAKRRVIVHYRYLALTDDNEPREPVCVNLEVV